MSEEEKEAKESIEYLKARLYGNEDCEYIDVAQKDLRIFINLVETQEKDIESWKKYSNEQEENIIRKNNQISNLEFLIEKTQKENEKYKRLAKINLKNAEEFKNNMCEHRCLLKSENEELQKENEELKGTLRDTQNSWFEDTKKMEKLKRDFNKANNIAIKNMTEYVSKKEIKDQIEHYQELQNNYIEKYDEISENIQSMINVLQVLLEEGGNK